MDDRELLRGFVERRSDDAFRQLVERHLPMVFSTARRMVRDAHLAEDVAQSVFTTFALKAPSIRAPQVVGGWLYNTTRNLALHAVRSEQRRREHERTAIAMQSLDLASVDPRIAEHLEPAMAELDADDRDVLVLRYLENRSLREVGAELGLSEDAARMRVSRALERLRTGLERQGVSVTTVLLTTAIGASTCTVPAGLGAAIASVALAGTAVEISTAAAATKAIGISAMQKALIVATFAVAVGTWIYLAWQASDSREQARTLQQGQTALTEQMQELERERDGATNRVALLMEQAERLKRELADLPRLRGEVARLREEARALTLAKEASAQTSAKLLTVAGIIITNIGRQLVSEEQIHARLGVKVGDVFNRSEVDRDVRQLYATGFYSNIRVLEARNDAGVVLTYILDQGKRQLLSKTLANVGSRTPDTALQTFLWAAKSGDSNLVGQMMGWRRERDDAVSDEMADRMTSAQARSALNTFSNLAGVRILAQRAEQADTTRMRVEFLLDDGKTHLGEVYMIRKGGEWKPALKFSRREGSTTVSSQYLLPVTPELDSVNQDAHP